MDPKFKDLVEGALLAVPLVAMGLGVFLGAKQVRSLRDLTGDRTWLTSIMGMTFRAPGEPNEEHLREHPPVLELQILKRRRAVRH